MVQNPHKGLLLNKTNSLFEALSFENSIEKINTKLSFLIILDRRS